MADPRSEPGFTIHVMTLMTILAIVANFVISVGRKLACAPLASLESRR